MDDDNSTPETPITPDEKDADAEEDEGAPAKDDEGLQSPELDNPEELPAP